MNIKNIIKEFIDKKRIAFTSIITLLVVITGLYTTYALNIFVDEGTPTEYDIALNFDLSNSVNRQMIVPAGKTKIFDVDITNPYSDSIKYGIAYTMVDPTTKPANVTIAQTNITKNPAVGLVEASSTASASIIVVNNSTSNVTVSFSVINGYKNGGELIVPTGKTLITDTYEVQVQPSFRYSVNPNCTNTTATFDYTRNRIIISNTTTSSSITCSPIKAKEEVIKFSDYIISLLGKNTSIASEAKPGDGSTLEKITENGEEDYRYRGINPNNYVMFNNELWRIIGVFDDNTHGIENTHLVKIIRNDSIGQYVWDNRTTVADTETTTNGWNNFPNSDIYNILNTAYYNHIDATGEEYCYSYQTSLTGKCDFRKIGIQTEYQSMVESGVNWFLGGDSSASSRTTMYQKERSTTKYSANNATTKEAGLTVPVGLMYASDYGYAAPSTCTSNLSAYNIDGCANKNWLKSNYYEWTITHSSSYSYRVFAVYAAGTLDYTIANYGYATRPTLYLKSSVYYLSGTGTQTDPYIIAM